MPTGRATANEIGNIIYSVFLEKRASWIWFWSPLHSVYTSENIIRPTHSAFKKWFLTLGLNADNSMLGELGIFTVWVKS